MKCPQCGKNIAGKVNFCPWCGYKDENGAMQGKGIRGYATDLIDKAKSIDEGKKKKIIKISVISLIAIILIVTIVILSVTLSNKFRVGKVSKAEIGMTMEEVEKILGKPNEEKDNYYYGGVNMMVYVYYESKAMKVVNGKNSDDIDDMESWEDFEKALEEEEKTQAKLESMKYKSIVVCFSGISNEVVDVAFNTNTRYDDSNPLFVDEPKQSKEFSLNKTFIAKGQSLASAELQYTAKYKDGSYRKGLIVYLDGFSSSEEGVQTLSFDNNWEKKDISLTVKEANFTVTSNNEKWGTVKGTGYYLRGQDVVLTATPKGENYIFDGWYDGDTKLSAQNPYTFKMSGEKEIKGKFVPVDWSKEPGFENFTVEQNSEGLTITGVKDDKITSITIPENVTIIGSQAFFNCSNLTNITIPTSIVSIGNGAFARCSSLTSITIPDSVTSIESNAFSDCPIETAAIPAIACSYIKNSNLKTVVITSGESIGEYAFRDCSILTSITIPDSVTNIGNDAFLNCGNLTSVYYTGDIASWCGITFSNYSSNPLYAHNLYIDNELIKDIIIPDTVTEIKANTFSGWNGTSITIPDSVTSIGNSVFSGCTATIVWGKNPAITTIGSYAFSGYNGTSITIPDSVTSIESYAFSGCTATIAWGKNPAITTIGSYAFSGYNGTSITIPDSVTIIESNAFSDCPIETATIPAFAISYIPKSNLKTVVITSGKSIGNSAFSGCGKLTSITIPDGVTSIGGGAFYRCRSLTSITIPDGVTSIGEYAFSLCSCLTSVMIPDSVTNIGNSAFNYCISLTSITLGNGVTSIGERAFDNCDSLTRVYYRGDIASWCGITFGNEYSNPLSYAHNLYINNKLIKKIVIPDTVTKIKANAFYGWNGTSITIPDSVTSIGNGAFNNCSSLTSVYYTGDIASWCGITFSGNPLGYAHNLYIDNKLIKDIVIPDTVTEIKKYAFYGWNGTSITIPKSVTSIGDSAFSGCTGLTSITIPDSVTSIGNYAFANCRSLTSITIPDSVTSIGERAFYDCSSLTSITIPDNLTSIGDYAFDNCRSLTSVTIGNSVTSIGQCAFSLCSSLTSITIPDSVTSIGWGAFFNCSDLTSITIPDSVTSIGGSAFYNCSSLQYNEYDNGYYLGNDNNPYIILVNAKNRSITSCTIHENTKFIHSDAFENCRRLTSITIPDGVTSIGYEMFSGCSSLTSITIPDSVTSIGQSAFSGCSSLTSITFQGTKAQWNAIRKDWEWNYNTGRYTVHCTDGDIEK